MTPLMQISVFVSILAISDMSLNVALAIGLL